MISKPWFADDITSHEISHLPHGKKLVARLVQQRHVSLWAYLSKHGTISRVSAMKFEAHDCQSALKEPPYLDVVTLEGRPEAPGQNKRKPET